jgi:hypothetical protein
MDGKILCAGFTGTPRMARKRCSAFSIQACSNFLFLRGLVPRGGVPLLNKFKYLAAGGTLILPTGSLGFLARVSHRYRDPSAERRSGSVWRLSPLPSAAI